MKTTFLFEKETPGTIRFKEDSSTPIIGTLYVKKSALKELDYKQGDSITITLTKGDDK